MPMNRRESLKTLALGAVGHGFLLDQLGRSESAKRTKFESDWHRWPDVRWAGPSLWGNRLQDWYIRDGAVECQVTAENRTLHCLTHRLVERGETFSTAVVVQRLEDAREGYVGFRIGARGRFSDYRSAAVFGEGIDAGITTGGRLFIGETRGRDTVDRPTTSAVRLLLEARPSGDHFALSLTALEPDGTGTLSSLQVDGLAADMLVGNVALVSFFDDEDSERPSARFSAWEMGGDRLVTDPAAAFGPVCFAQYTLHRGTLKLTAQLAPIEEIEGHRVVLEVHRGGRWEVVGEDEADPLSRTAHFRAEGWDASAAVPYRIRVHLPLASGTETFDYEGTVAREPTEADRLKVAVFSCNSDYGFPDSEVVRHVGRHRPDLAVFLGDQYYESHGGFGIQTTSLEKATLDVLRKWYMFGWSYRDLFRHIPSAFIPDDHDVYHGNVWGEGGEHAPTGEGWGYAAQDQGGYKMPPEWIDAVQRSETGHLPDPYDPTPVKQGIGVYYTAWDYAGVSFALLEDRKFKSAPQNVLPEGARVENGFVTNTDFDPSRLRDQPDAVLLGERQMEFLNRWVGDWRGGTQLKAVLSQTNLCTVHTLPAGSTDDKMVPGLAIPPPGVYVQGDAPALDMDSNGWPPNRRDDVVRLLRKAFAFHIAGDQHLATLVHYGVDEFGDAGFAFTGPALNNIWPRRWWPPVGEDHRPLPDRPPYTGDFHDAFGNRITVHAVANPHQTGREPSIIYDRATGYGIVTFDKARRTIDVECWPRYVDPSTHPDGQYADWPVAIRQEDNYGRAARAWLPNIAVEGLDDPVIEVVDERIGEMVYTLRIKGRTFQPKVFAEGTYSIRVGDPDRALFKKRRGLAAVARKEAAGSLTVHF